MGDNIIMKIINKLFNISSNKSDTNKQLKIRYKIITNLFIIFVIVSNCSLFGGSIIDKFFGITATVKKENTILENSINKKMSDISAELGVVKNNQLSIKNDVESLLKIAANLDSRIDAKIVGYDKSVRNETNTSAGRDISTTNESELIEFIFDKWAYAVGVLITGFFGLLGSIFSLFKWQGRMYERLLDAKQKWIENLIKSNNDKDDKMDTWLMGKIDKQNGNK